MRTFSPPSRPSLYHIYWSEQHQLPCRSAHCRPRGSTRLVLQHHHNSGRRQLQLCRLVVVASVLVDAGIPGLAVGGCNYEPHGHNIGARCRWRPSSSRKQLQLRHPVVAALVLAVAGGCSYGRRWLQLCLPAAQHRCSSWLASQLWSQVVAAPSILAVASRDCHSGCSTKHIWL